MPQPLVNAHNKLWGGPSKFMTTTQMANNRADLEASLKQQNLAPEVAEQKRQQLEQFIADHTDPKSYSPAQQAQLAKQQQVQADNAASDQRWQQRLQREAGAV